MIVKDMVKSIIRSIQKNRISFYFEKKRHLSEHQENPALAPDKNDFEILQRDGILVKENFYNRDYALRLFDYYKKDLKTLQEDKYTGQHRNFRYADMGLFRLYVDDREEFPKIVKRFLFDEYIHKMAQAYMSPKVKNFGCYLDYKSGIGSHCSNTVYHTDHWQKRFKAFLCLSDVTEKNAPFRYMKKSHREAFWRQKHEFKHYYNPRKHSTDLSLLEMKRIREEYGYEEIACIAPAGSLILADTRGIHSGTILKENYRCLLVNQFRIGGALGKSQR